MSYICGAVLEIDLDQKGDTALKIDYTEGKDKAQFLSARSASQKEYDLTAGSGGDNDYPARYGLLMLDAIEVEGNDLRTDRDILGLTLQLVCASPTARAMIMEAADYEWHLGLVDLEASESGDNGEDFFIDMPRRTIYLDNHGMSAEAIGRSGYFQNQLMIALARGLRDIWQDRRYSAFPGFDAESLLMLERVRAADIDVMSVLVAWELRSEGYNDVWRHVIGTENGDIAMAFSNYLDRDPSAGFSGMAMRHAFTQWFASEDRINLCDHRTLEFMDEVIEAGEEIGVRKTRPRDVEVLSCQPDRRAYLQGMGEEILRGPLYAGLCDPINQAHFMQIMQDKDLTYRGGVSFRNASLAAKIFPVEHEA